MQHFWPLALCSFCVQASLFAQFSQAKLNQLIVDGVGFHKNANVIYEDQKGFLWIGTNDGLYKYDGQDLTAYQYDVFDPTSIPNNTITSICEDDTGNLWIGTESYLVHYDRAKDNFHNFFKNSTTYILGKSKDGVIYANHMRKGFVMVNPGGSMDSLSFATSQDYGKKSRVLGATKKINAFIEDIHGRIWFGTPKGIVALHDQGELKPTSFTEHTFLLTRYKESSFLAVTQKAIYVLGYRKGDRQLEVLERLQLDLKANVTPVDLTYNSEKSEYFILATDRIIKVGSLDNQLKIVEQFSKSATQMGDTIFKSMVFDQHDNLWIASADGVFKLLNKNFVFETLKLPESVTSVTSLFTPDGETLFVGTANGALLTSKMDGPLRIHNELQDAAELSLLTKGYTSDKVWLGVDSTLKKMVFGQNSTSKTLETVKAYKASIKDVVAISPNELVVGLWGGGIDILNTTVPLSPFKKDLMVKLNDLIVSVLHYDRNNRLWIGTRGNGIYVADLINEKLKRFYPENPEGLNSNAILCFLELDGKMFIGTRGGGINVYDPKTEKFRVYAGKEGLNSLTISAMEADNHGNIWAATVEGITFFDVASERFTNFGPRDGLTENEFNFNDHAKDVKGNIYFTNGKGVIKVRPDQYNRDERLANTLITNFEILGTSNSAKAESESLIDREKIILLHDQNNISIKFASLDLTAPEKNKFAYMMEGVNDYWIYTSANNNSANYNGLDPGDYTFKVKSTNSHGIWNEEPATLRFSIKPSIWASNTALFLYVLCSLLAISGVILLIKNWYLMKKNLVAETVSHQKDKEHHQMKMVFFTDISHELRTPLTLIQGTIEKVIRDGKYRLQESTAKRIYNNSLRIGRLIDQIMAIRKNDVGAFSLKVGKGNIVHDMLNLKNAFNDFARIKQIEYKLISSEKHIEAYYDLQILEKVLFNLLSNAFKYTSEKGRVTISVDTTHITSEKGTPEPIAPGQYVRCSVEDNGLGIATENLPYIFDRYYQTTKMPVSQVPGTGIGMELAQKLIHAHGGTIEVVSEEHKYTRFIFLLPIEKSHYTDDQLLEGHMERKPSITAKSEYQVFDEVTSNGLHKEKMPWMERPKILLVEDNHELRHMMREELFYEFEILEAENGREGYQKAMAKHPNLIISDILMPVEDGVSMLRKIKQEDDLADIPIFMLSAKDSEEIKLECLSLGATDYIEKPFSPDFLMWKVKNLLFSRASLKNKYSKVISVNTSEVDLESNEERFIKKLVQIVEDHLEDSSLGVEYLASEVGMSRANLYRKLQAILNETPVNFIKKFRLKRARQLLEKNHLYVSEVAYMTGFNNPKYFAKCFGKEFGLSPSEYAEQFSKKKNAVKSIPIDIDKYIL